MKPNDQLEGVRVLVVEDDRDTREIVQFVLEQSGAVVTSAESVPQALDAYAAAAPNVVVADIGLPVYNGYALIARIREEDAKLGRNTLAIALTAFTSPADKDTALSTGFQAYMAKPFDPAVLISTISGLVKSTGSPNIKEVA